MFFADTASTDDTILSQYQEDEVEAGGLPYIQVLTHPNEDIIDVKDNRPWGLFLPTDNAEAVNFKPDANWKPVTFYTVEGQGFNQAVLAISDKKRAAYTAENREITEHTGFLATTLLCHFLYQSETEIEERIARNGKTYYRFTDLRWRDGQPTPAAKLLGDRDEDDRPTHRWIRRFLLLPVSADGPPLCNLPLQYKAKGGAGGAFTYELQAFFNDVDKAYSQLRQKKVRLSKNRCLGDGRTFLRAAFEFNLFKPGVATVAYLVPSARLQPLGKAPSSPAAIKAIARGKDNERSVNVMPVGLASLMLPRESSTAHLLNTLLQECAEFPLPPQPNDAVPSSAQGQILMGATDPHVTPDFLLSGDVVTTFDTGSERLQITIPPAHSALLDWTHAEVTVNADGRVQQAIDLSPAAPAQAPQAQVPQLAAVGADIDF